MKYWWVYSDRQSLAFAETMFSHQNLLSHADSAEFGWFGSVQWAHDRYEGSSENFSSLTRVQSKSSKSQYKPENETVTCEIGACTYPPWGTELREKG